MGNPVENPMAHHADPNGQRAATVVSNSIIKKSKPGGKNQTQQQTVRPRIIRKIKRGELRVTGINPHSLPAQQQ